MEKKKFDVEFHGTNLFALVPLLLFVVFCILFFVVFKTFDMMHLCMGGYVALIIGSLLSKNWGKYWDAVATGMSSKIMNELALILLIVAFIKRNIYVACTWGLISGTIIGLVSGILVPSDIMGMQDGTLGGFLIDGVNNMIGTVGYLYAIAGIIGILSASGLLQQVIDGLVHSKLNRSVVGTEVIISVGLMVSSICLGSANGPAIIMWGPIANDLGKSKGLHPYRRANLMDGFGSTLPAVIPVTSAFIFIALSCIQGLMDTYSFVQEVSPVSLAGASLHCWFLFVVLAVAVITGWGRKYEGPNGEPVKALPAQTK